ncbi:Similar to Claspin: Claspin (Drosophila melanogaster) [Cotesia congregata]|uniref:Similar to Claspin: Claspin (Drosophila melanogaster) n=1 Tax=Cotesia congregata TaxID=51543 RepID=A0A8J2HPZ4_COTCN|nr:Similar to Claspin: Claspin (Drosophila melanogaster) [Cotesia congregata]
MDENSDNSDEKMHDPILNTDLSDNVPEENINTLNLVNKESVIENAHSTSEASEIDPVNKDKNSEVDSDSSDVEDRNKVNFQEYLKKKAATRLRILVDTDSEDDEPKKLNSVTISSSTQASPVKSKSKSRLRINSDSSDDSPRKNQINDDKSDSDEDLIAKNRSKRLNELVDSDSEEEIVSKSVGPRILADSDDEKEETGKGKKTKKEKKRTGSKRSAKDEAMRQIHSETQRLLREAPVSLPYHRPRQRTLEEFLNRKKIAPVLPQATSTFARMKMSAEIVSRALEEKEREAELFYKSESDEDSGGEREDAGHVEDNGDGVSDSHLGGEKSDGIDQDAVKHVTRQLFNDDSSESLGVKSQSISDGVISLSSGSEDKLLKESSCENNLESILDEKLDSQESVILSKESNEFSSLELNDSPVLDAVKIISTSTESEEDTIVLSSENDKTETEGNKCDGNFELEDLNSQSDKSDSKELDKCGALNGDINDRLNAVKSTENISSSSSISKTSIIDEVDLFCNGSEHVLDEVKEVEKNVPAPVVDKKKTLMNFPELKPKIRGAPGMMIDFTKEMKPNKEAIDNLLDRFLSKHAGSKPSNVNTEVTVLQTEATATGLKVTKDVLAYKNVASNANDPELNKPGAKLVRLKEDLKKQMADKRHEEWVRKEQDVVADDEEDEEEEEGEEKNKGEKEVEEEIMDIDEEEEELEEDDVPMKDKRISCAFGDDEAEVSEEEQIHLSDDEDEDEGEEEDDDEEEEEKEEESTQCRKRFSRIVALDEDSNSDDEDSKPKKVFERTRTDVDIFEDSDDLKIPAGQRQSSPSPETVQLRETLSSVVGSKSTQGIPESPVRSLPSQLNNWDIECTPSITESPGKLFEVQSKPVTDEELMNLCSGKFTDGNNTQASNPRLSGLIDHSANEKPITDSQIINLCSGTFTSPDYGSQSVNNVDESSQDMCLRFDENSQNGVEVVKKKVEEILKEKEKEEEEKKEEILRVPLKIVSSSENEDIDEVEGGKGKKKVLKKKKKINKLVLSDDEDEDNFTDEEQVDQSDEEKFIDYDSEENEVVVVPKREIKKVAANFLEAEAELSESEWGSEDEDEKDLDKFEIEEGDAEDIDENLMKDQLGKIHARQLLDDDQRDVRMLQELLFEDGDLHTDGSGRERRFKWKNIDKIGDDFLEGPKNDEDDDNPADPNELANEIEWRKMRLEREKFLEEKMKSTDDSLENELGLGGQFFKLALAKLAQVIKQSDNALTSNHSKHFLFTHLSPAVDDSKGKVAETEAENLESDDKKGRKRKSAAGDTPKLAKKTKLENPSSKKKLF